MESLPKPSYDADPVEMLKIDSALFENAHKDLPNPYYHEKDQNNDFHNLPSVELIQQIVAEFGDFKTITEDRLINMIEGDAEMLDTDETEQEEDGLKAYIEQAIKKREHMLHHVHMAYNSASVASDFVSLLVSSVRPNAAQSSMSSLLKQHVKLGSLSYTVIENNKDQDQVNDSREKDIQYNKKIGRGWKLDSLRINSAKLKKVAADMKLKIHNEQTYWKDMFDIAQSNEVISTTNIQNSTGKEICIKYGFGDSGSVYYDKGIGLLKKSENGHVKFEKIDNKERDAVWGGEKVVYIKIYKREEDGLKLVGQSNTLKFVEKQLPEILKQNDKENEGADAVLKEVKKSRFFLFENELYWHLIKEAAGLIALNVELIDNYDHGNLELKSKIRFDIPTAKTTNALNYDNEQVVEIGTLDLDEIKEQGDLTSLSDNSKADNLILILRLLLCESHRRNQERRSLPPIAMSSQAKPVHDVRDKYGFLIRPIIMHSRHNVTVKSISGMFTNIIETLGLKEKAEVDIQKRVDNKKDLDASTDDSFTRLCSNIAPKSIEKLKIKLDDEKTLTVVVEFTSNYSTVDINYDVEILFSKTHRPIFKSGFSNRYEMEECLKWIIKSHL